MLPAAPRKTFWCWLGQAGWECAKIIQSRLGGLEILQSTEDAQLVQAGMRQPVTQMLCDIGAAPEIPTKKEWKCFAVKPHYCLADICKEEAKGFIKNQPTNNKQFPAWNHIVGLPDPKFFCFIAMNFPFQQVTTESFILQTALRITWLPLN